MGPLQLAVVWGSPGLVGQVFPLTPGREVHVGRSRGYNEIRLEDRHLSRQHLILRVTAEGVWVRDLDTLSGTYLNCRHVPRGTEQAVLPGDFLGAGGTILRLGPVLALDPGWLRWNGGAVVALARRIREGHRTDLLPVLADALEEAGCSDAELLGHLRGPGPHVRGCWAVDLLTGRG
jgi:pSer/pThr/pTyr-binding forkhead associated (FHA) protein